MANYFRESMLVCLRSVEFRINNLDGQFKKVEQAVGDDLHVVFNRFNLSSNKMAEQEIVMSR